MNGTLLATRQAQLGPMYPRFSMWDTTGKWSCCGGRTPNATFVYVINSFSMFSSNPDVTLSNLPPTPTSTSTTSSAAPATMDGTNTSPLLGGGATSAVTLTTYPAKSAAAKGVVLLETAVTTIFAAVWYCMMA
ncbi:hypothetical protein HK101_009456 [Irineochytrium annulatum]|nr:hypothetical protein HK101_009456 [Irineochytrium annulatum]